MARVRPLLGPFPSALYSAHSGLLAGDKAPSDRLHCMAVSPHLSHQGVRSSLRAHNWSVLECGRQPDQSDALSASADGCSFAIAWKDGERGQIPNGKSEASVVPGQLYLVVLSIMCPVL